jgi:hypothetical protein
MPASGAATSNRAAPAGEVKAAPAETIPASQAAAVAFALLPAFICTLELLREAAGSAEGAMKALPLLAKRATARTAVVCFEVGMLLVCFVCLSDKWLFHHEQHSRNLKGSRTVAQVFGRWCFFFVRALSRRVMASVPSKPRNKLALKRKRPAEPESAAAIEESNLAAAGSVACSTQIASAVQCRRIDARTILGAIDPDGDAAAADSNVQHRKNRVAAVTCAVPARSPSTAAAGAADAAGAAAFSGLTAAARSPGPSAAADATVSTSQLRPAQSLAASQEAGLHSCFVCSADLQELSLLARQVHLNACLDGTAATGSSSSSSTAAHHEAAAVTAVATQQQSKAQRPTSRCSIAGRSPKSVNQEELLLAKGLSASLNAALNGTASSSSSSSAGRGRGSAGRGRGRSASVIPGELYRLFAVILNT